MKKILIFITLLILSISAFAQPATRSTINVNDDKLHVRLNFIPPRYDDTTQANLNLGLDSCGAIIYTRTDQKLWKRVCFPTKHWEEIRSGGGFDYVKSGTYIFVDSVGESYIVNIDTASLYNDVKYFIGIAISKIQDKGNFATASSINAGDSNIVHNFSGKSVTIDSIYHFNIKRSWEEDSIIVLKEPFPSGVIIFVGSRWILSFFSPYENADFINDNVDTIFVKTINHGWQTFTDTTFLSGEKYFISQPGLTGTWGDSIIISKINKQRITLPVNRSYNSLNDSTRFLVTEKDEIKYRTLPNLLFGNNVNNNWGLRGNLLTLKDTTDYLGTNNNYPIQLRSNKILVASLFADSSTSNWHLSIGRDNEKIENAIALGTYIYNGASGDIGTNGIFIGSNINPIENTNLLIGNNINGHATGKNLLIGNNINLSGSAGSNIVLGSNNVTFIGNVDNGDLNPYDNIILGNNADGFYFFEHPTFILSPQIKQLHFPLNSGATGSVLTNDGFGTATWQPPSGGSTEYLKLSGSDNTEIFRIDSTGRNYTLGITYFILQDSIKAVSRRLISDSAIWNKIGTNKWSLRNTTGDIYRDTLSIGGIISFKDESTEYDDYLIARADELRFTNSYKENELGEDPIFMAGLDYIASSNYGIGSTLLNMNSPSGIGRTLYLPKMTTTDTLANKLWVMKTISDSADEIKLHTPLNVEEDTIRFRYNFTSLNPSDTLKMANVGTLVELVNATADDFIYLDANKLTNMKVGETIKLFNNNASNFDFEIVPVSGTTLRGREVINQFGSAELIKRDATTFFILNTQ